MPSEPGWRPVCVGARDLLLPCIVQHGGHVWLHSECWAGHRERRRDEAVAALRGMGISVPSENDFVALHEN